MVKQLEKEVEKAVCDYAKKFGWTYRKQQGQGSRGKADRYFIRYPRQIVYVEFKAPGEKLSVLQKKEINFLQDRGFMAVGIDTIEMGYKFFDTLEQLDKMFLPIHSIEVPTNGEVYQ